MDFAEYQEATRATAVYPGQKQFTGLAYAALGLNGEAGETAEKVKKTWRDAGVDVKATIHEALDQLIYDLGFTAPELYSMRFEQFAERIDAAFDLELDEEIHKGIVKELGDTLWYAAAVADEIGVTLEDVAQQNIDKLRSRLERDVLHGSGDER